MRHIQLYGVLAKTILVCFNYLCICEATPGGYILFGINRGNVYLEISTIWRPEFVQKLFVHLELREVAFL